MDKESLYRQLGQLVADMPDLAGSEPITPETHKWLARAAVLVGEVGDLPDTMALRVAADHLVGVLRGGYAHQIAAIVHRALARVEALVPAAMLGVFIPVGAQFDALQAVGKVLREAKSDVLIVDPYMDARVLTDFAPMVPEGVGIRLLNDSFSTKPEVILPSAERWRTQYGVARPLEVRQSQPRALHDRLIFVDHETVWSLTQSLKNFAARSPASVVQIVGEAAPLKIDAYQYIWDGSSRLL
ncbi:MAG: hypothetical protein OZ924_15640 [Burkholderiaceae bacterium]|nr:hypothetical protein [Burkholderiaceae bacterium]